MGFLTNIVRSAVKVVLTPIAVVKDVANIATNNEVDSTKNLLSSAADDLAESIEDWGDGEIL